MVSATGVCVTGDIGVYRSYLVVYLNEFDGLLCLRAPFVLSLSKGANSEL